MRLIPLRNPTQSHQCGDIRKRRAANQSGFVLVLVLIVIVVATMAIRVALFWYLS